MKFYYPKENEKLHKLVRSPLFSELIGFLYARERGSVIHRELAARFPQRELEVILESAIGFGLIERKNRRYSLAFPVFDEAEVLPEAAQILAEAAAALVKLEDGDCLQILNRLWEEWFIGGDYFFAVKRAADFYERRVTGIPGLSFINFSFDDAFTLNLADYFYVLDHELPMTAVLKPLEVLIGDVNRTYFFQQVEVVFEKIQAGEPDKIKKNIFVTALQLTSVVDVGLTSILVPQIAKAAVSLPEVFDKLDFSEDKATSSWQKSCYFVFLLDHLDRKAYTFISDLCPF